MKTKDRLHREGIVEFTMRYRNLPHLEQPGAIYFTTTSTHAKAHLNDTDRDTILSSIRFLDGRKYDLHAAVVMPDHMHLIFESLEKKNGIRYSLSEIFHSIKSFTAHELKRPIWQDENYDHIIRNERDYHEKIIYLINNPVEAGLADVPERYRWLYSKFLVSA